ncbi:hypothetical protein LCGC14_2783310, partial [marine sediment metagenome]
MTEILIDPVDRVAARAAQVAGRRIGTTQAAQRLGVHRKTLIKWVREGVIDALRTPAEKPAGSRLKFLERDVTRL